MSTNGQESPNFDNSQKTEIIHNLMQTAFEQRDESWRDNFLKAIDGANLKLAQQEVVIGADGFPYVQLETVKPSEGPHAFVINKQLPTLLEQGLGIVINVQNNRADWAFSYGDIVNLELNDEFYTDDSIFSRQQEIVSLSQEEKVLIGQPSGSILPKYLRTHLREFLKHFGVETPKIMLLARQYEDEKEVTQDLVFNFTPARFANEEAFNEVMKTITWFLPRHYSFFCIEEKAIANGFEQI